MHVIVALVLLLAALCVAGCNTGEIHVSGNRSTGGSTATTTSGAGGSGLEAGGGGGTSCDDDCPSPPDGWLGPSLFAVGPFSELPPCPDSAPDAGIEAYAGLVPTAHTCPVCQCSDSETTCTLPSDWHASAAPCPGDGAPQITLDPPASWNGECTSKNLIPSGAQCGGTDCVQSVTVSAPGALAAPCGPVAVGQPAFPAAKWTLRARECLPRPAGTCPRELPDCSFPQGFGACIHREGDHTCPPSYPLEHHLHLGTDDARACAPCACGPPEGNACIVFVTAYKTTECTTVAGAINVASDVGPGCFDVPPGFGLGGKTADVVATEEGTCRPSGGEPTGALAAAKPLTLCCQGDLPK